jgi:hypothetical protein
MAKKKVGVCEFAKVKTACPFELTEAEACVFDSIAEEHVSGHGTDLLFWHQDVEHSIRDPLYDEPIDRAWRGPYALKGFVEYMAGQPQMDEQGMTVRWRGFIWIARSALESAGAPAPLEGDVLKFWDNKFFTEHSVNSDEDAIHGPPPSGYFFDVINADDDGHIFDTGHFVGLKLEVMRRTEFTPERRLET